MRKLVSIAALALIAACASTPAYGPASGSGAGYQDQRIETGRYRVSFRSGDADFAENGALRRAAELTIENGFDWFTVVSRDLERERSGGGSSIGLGGGTGGRSGGVGLGVNIPVTGGRETVTARLEVVMGRGDQPDGPRTYDASEIAQNLTGG